MPVGSTPVNVGPGKYNINKEAKKVTSKANAPFGARSERENILIAQTISPGPGLYKPLSSFENIPGGRISFKNGPRLAATAPNRLKIICDVK